MKIGRYVKKIPLLYGGYYGLKEAVYCYQKATSRPYLTVQKEGKVWRGRLPIPLRDTWLFEDRSRHCRKLCMVLAGYKPTIWDTVFGRLERTLPEDVDVCVLTSGLRSEDLRQLCAQNGWSYLATKKNKVSRIQNIAIHLHPDAEYIYKLDEDIFLTEGFFDTLYATLQTASKDSGYEIGLAAPLIPVNGYGYVRILEKLGLTKDWESRFGPAVITDGIHHHTAILDRADAARYMWGESQPVLGNIDALAATFAQAPPAYSVCPIRFSIGAILFARKSWVDWGMFPVDWSAGMGLDEMWIARYCVTHGRAVIVSENTLVGHLGYGPQTEDMLRYFLSGEMCV